MKNSKSKRALAVLMAALMVFDGAASIKAYAKEESENVQGEQESEKQEELSNIAGEPALLKEEIAPLAMTNDSMGTAAEMNLYDQYDVDLEEGKEAYYAFTPEEDGTYQFYSTGEYDTIGTLYISEGNDLTSDDDGGEDRNFKIVYKLEAGKTYYLRVRGYSNRAVSCKVAVQKMVLVISYDSTQTVRYGEDVALLVNASSNAGEIRYQWYQSKDGEYIELQEAVTDSYTFRADEAGSYKCIVTDGVFTKEAYFDVTVSTGLSVSAKQYYYGRLGEKVTLSVAAESLIQNLTYEWYYEEDTDQKVIIEEAKGAEYELLVTEDSAKTYYCTVSDGIESQTVSMSLEVGNGANDSIGTAVEMNLYNQYDVDLEEGKEAYYAFTPEEDGTYQLYSSGEYDTMGTLLDSEGNDLTSDDDGGEDRNFKIVYKLEAGKTYYLRVCGYSKRAVSCKVAVQKAELTIFYDSARTVLYGEDATLSVNASSNAGEIRYQWYQNKDGEYIELQEAVSDSYTFRADEAGSYKCIVTDGVFTKEAYFDVTVSTGLSASAKQYYYGGLGEKVTLSVTAESAVQNLTYEWYYYEENTYQKVVIEEAKGAECELLATADSAKTYYCTVSDGIESQTVSMSLEVGNYTYQELEDGSIEITGYRGDEEEVQIPSEIGGKKVAGVGRNAFRDNSSLRSITIPSGVTNIETSVFDGCSGLMEIEVENENPNYADYDGCLYNKNKTILIRCPEGKMTVTIFSGVTGIGDNAFNGCISLTNVAIPESVISIGDSVFDGCSSLKEIIMNGNNMNYLSEDGVLYSRDGTRLICCPQGKDGTITIMEGATSIAEDSFLNCRNLTGVEIPEGVSSIGENAFKGCSNLMSIIIPEDVIVIGDNAFKGCSSLAGITIPERVTGIGSGVFQDCNILVNVTIPEGVTSVGQSAFSGCSSLTNVSIPESVTSIEALAFSECSSLTNVTIAEGVTDIGDNAFKGCQSLISITLPGNVTSIGSEVFSGCSSLTEIMVDGNNPSYFSEDGILYKKDGTKLICCPEGRKGTVAIKEGITSVEQSAFKNCKGLVSIAIPESVTSIGWCVFDGCSSLMSMTIPERVTSIENWTFRGCQSLTSITIPESVTQIDYSAFAGCGSLKNVAIPEGVTDIGGRAFEKCGNLKSIAIPESVTHIGDEAFSECPVRLSVHTNSYAEEYARENGIEYKYICKEHTVVIDESAEPTCGSDGETEGSHCSVCGEILTPQVSIPAIGEHTYEIEVQKATTKENGVRTWRCSVCGEEKETVIYYPKTISLAKTKYTYNGKAQKPSVIVKDSKGEVIAPSNYAVTYPSGRKNVGTYTVSIKFKNHYSGTVKKTFSIFPKGTSLSGMSAKSKGFTAKWKKQSVQTTGYEIQYSLDSKFKKGNKIQDVKKNQTTSQNIAKLKAKKKYYVRIRTYKNVKVNGKSKKIYSDWSKARNVTTKK